MTPKLPLTEALVCVELTNLTGAQFMFKFNAITQGIYVSLFGSSYNSSVLKPS
jgi:hypothetical protein